MDSDTKGRLTIDVLTDGGLRIRNDGMTTPNDLILAAHYLIRTADQMLDMQAMAGADHKTIERVAALPDALRNGGGLT